MNQDKLTTVHNKRLCTVYLRRVRAESHPHNKGPFHNYPRHEQTVHRNSMEHSEDLRCMYASKLCPNVRDRKPNGELHRLCEFHREKANEAQRRWLLRQREVATSNAPTKSDKFQPHSIDLLRAHSGELTDDEIARLSQTILDYHYAHGLHDGMFDNDASYDHCIVEISKETQADHV